MRHAALFFSLICGACSASPGSGAADLSAEPPPVDAAPILDLALLDLLSPPPPPACSLPAARAYSEHLGYLFVQLGGGGGQFGTDSYNPVSVTNRGQIVRPKVPLTSGSYHCDFTEANIDAMTCTAPCCQGQPASPIVYVDSTGWSMWQSGSCAYTVGPLQYVATISYIGTMIAH
ncbi:MAG TPA: hypothetical protein VFI56_09170 [Vicinamibacterales bacterium]|nr:hypothetical protein [Vicinamibacterales bacterium]